MDYKPIILGNEIVTKIMSCKRFQLWLGLEKKMEANLGDSLIKKRYQIWRQSDWLYNNLHNAYSKYGFTDKRINQ